MSSASSSSSGASPASELAAVFARLREEYAGTPLSEDQVPDNPFALFQTWFGQAVAAELPMVNAMTLATVDAHGQPAARIVLLKCVDRRGLVFFSNYQSRKGRELDNNPLAALLFYWQPLDRQVRVEGTVERIQAEDSDEYFATRPRDSNLSAMASPQSQIIEHRGWLEERIAELRASYDARPLERPAHWGGYRVVPRVFEFWQGQPDRLHDRLCYTASAADRWLIQRLAP